MSSYPPPDPASWGPPSQGPGAYVPTPEERNWAIAAHIGSIVTAWFYLGAIAPLIVLLVKGSASPYIRRNAVESLNFQINALAYSLLLTMLLFVLIGFLLLPLVPVYLVFYIVCVIVATVRASAGREFRYPLTVRIVT